MGSSSAALRRGVGPLIASAFAAEIGDPAVFHNGRQVSAGLGLVPRQHSSGGKPRLFGISKHGDAYRRTLLIHGARAVVRTAARYDDPLSRWLRDLSARRGLHKAHRARQQDGPPAVDPTRLRLTHAADNTP